MGFKISLFDDDDLEAVETMLVNVMVRALRQITHEGLWPGSQQAAAAPREAPPAPAPPVPRGPAILPDVPEVQQQPTWHVRRMNGTPLRHVSAPPPGYISKDDARTLMAGDDKRKRLALDAWIRQQQVPAVIVDGMVPFSSGLKGRIMVERAGIEQREARRWAHKRKLEGLLNEREQMDAAGPDTRRREPVSGL